MLVVPVVVLPRDELVAGRGLELLVRLDDVAVDDDSVLDEVERPDVVDGLGAELAVVADATGVVEVTPELAVVSDAPAVDPESEASSAAVPSAAAPSTPRSSRSARTSSRCWRLAETRISAGTTSTTA